MPYPFETLKTDTSDLPLFKAKLPQVTSAVQELFRAMNVAYRSIEQRDIFGNYGGLRRDNGFETALNLMWVAMINDRVIASGAKPAEFVNKLRLICLRWYEFGNHLDACLFFGYFFYLFQSQTKFIVRDQVQDLKMFIDNANQTNSDPTIQKLLKPSHSSSWYQTEEGIGDKLNPIFIANSDLLRVELPLPGYQITFQKSYLYDLRAPNFISRDQIEIPTKSDGRVIISCPKCGQKCRGKIFSLLEMTCPKCQQAWVQRV
jgi:hypothetical protein